MNKLRGRMLVLPKTKSTPQPEILIVYGQHSSIDKWFALADIANEYGSITMPDMPGFGGMGSFYKINEKPTIENYADYLASFIKLKYRRKQIVIIGMSFGFIVVTRMLQKYPELVKKVKLLINVSGFTHFNDLKMSKWKLKLSSLTTRVFALSIPAQLYKEIFYDEFIFKLLHPKPKSLPPGSKPKQLLKQELKMRCKNDIRSHMYITNQMLKLDICQQSIDLPVWSITGNNDQYLNKDSVKRHLEMIYSKYHEIELNKKAHSDTLGYATIESLKPLIPYRLRALLMRQK